MSVDRECQIKAIELLDSSLSGIEAFPEESGINKNDLVQMYMDSRQIVRMNIENLELNRTAESVWATCIRVVRCSGVIGEEAKELIINQKSNYPEAKKLYEHAKALYKTMQEQENC